MERMVRYIRKIVKKDGGRIRAVSRKVAKRARTAIRNAGMSATGVTYIVTIWAI